MFVFLYTFCEYSLPFIWGCVETRYLTANKENKKDCMKTVTYMQHYLEMFLYRAIILKFSHGALITINWAQDQTSEKFSKWQSVSQSQFCCIIIFGTNVCHSLHSGFALPCLLERGANYTQSFYVPVSRCCHVLAAVHTLDSSIELHFILNTHQKSRGMSNIIAQ